MRDDYTNIRLILFFALNSISLIIAMPMLYFVFDYTENTFDEIRDIPEDSDWYDAPNEKSILKLIPGMILLLTAVDDLMELAYLFHKRRNYGYP